MGNYQKLVDYIRDTAKRDEVNPHGFFMHGRRSDASLNFDKPQPYIDLYPFTSTLDNNNKSIATHNIIMGFYKQDTPDTTVEQREEIISDMDVLSDKFIKHLDSDDDIDIEITNVRKEPFYRGFAGTLSGYAITFTAKTHASLC